MKPHKKPIPAQQILAFIQECSGGNVEAQDVGFDIERVTPLHTFSAHTLSFAKSLNEERLQKVSAIRDGLLLIDLKAPAPDCPYIRVDNPRYMFGRIMEAFFNIEWYSKGIAPTAVIDPSASIGEDVSIGAYAVIGPGVVIGNRTAICSHVTIGPNVQIGEDCIIQSSTVIGQPGLGTDNHPDGRNYYLPHIGSAIIGNRVWIGALTTVCAGTIDPTIVEDDSIIDDHVHIAHNAVVGSNGLIAAVSEVSGSTVLGRDVRIAPGASTMNGITIGEGSIIGLGAVVTKSQPARVVLAGVPAKILRTLEE